MNSSEKKILTLPLRIALSILIIGLLFKIMHWPYSDYIMCSSFIIILILYPIRFWKKRKKAIIDWVKLVFVLLWTINGIIVVEHLPFKYISSTLTLFFFIVWLIIEFTSNRKKVKENLLHSEIPFIAGFFIIIGGIFKIMHWPGATIILIIGLLSVVLWVLFRTIKKSK